jgi:hypothetical protein
MYFLQRGKKTLCLPSREKIISELFIREDFSESKLKEETDAYIILLTL